MYAFEMFRLLREKTHSFSVDDKLKTMSIDFEV